MDGVEAARAVKVREVQPGFRFEYRDVQVVALRAPEPFDDRFGRPMLRFWARRADTDAEGWMEYGPDADIDPSSSPANVG